MNKTKNPKAETAGSKPARLRILDKEVQIACKPGEEDDLLQAAAYIDQSMRDLRRRSNTSSIEKIAIVTAINTANALLKSRSQEGSGTDDIVSERLASLNGQLDELLAEPANTKLKSEPESTSTSEPVE
ncbi:MAG: cell division protein ZapA [Granulosicoccus sp.]|jgi:cell division protein ZapA